LVDYVEVLLLNNLLWWLDGTSLQVARTRRLVPAGMLAGLGWWSR
jgi:hypothetical protein